MSIFKKYAQNSEEVEDSDLQPINYSGEYAVLPKKPFNKQFIDDLKQEYLKAGKVRHIPSNRKSPVFGESLIIMPDGSIDDLDRWHSTYMGKATDNLLRKNQSALYLENFEMLGDSCYERIHHLFSGGIRVWLMNNWILINCYQIPNAQQMGAIQKILNFHGGRGEITLDIEVNGERRALFREFRGLRDLKAFLDGVKNMQDGALERINTMRLFRDQTEQAIPKMTIERPLFGEYAKSENIPFLKPKGIPPSMRYPGASNIFSQIKISQELSDIKTEPEIEKHIPNYSGLFATQPKKLLDKDYVEDYRQEHNKLIINPPSIDLLKDKNIIIMPDGAIQIARRGHAAHDYEVNHNISNKNKDKRLRYDLNRASFDFDSYLAFHHVFDGAIRAWCLKYTIHITAHQLPNLAQKTAIANIFEKNNLGEMKIELFLNVNGTNQYIARKITSINEFWSFFNTLEQQLKSNNNQDTSSERLEKIRFFRNPVDVNERFSPPTKKLFPDTNLSRQQIENILKKIKLKTPPSMRYPGAENTLNIKIAQEHIDNLIQIEDEDLPPLELPITQPEEEHKKYQPEYKGELSINYNKLDEDFVKDFLSEYKLYSKKANDDLNTLKFQHAQDTALSLIITPDGEIHVLDTHHAKYLEKIYKSMLINDIDKHKKNRYKENFYDRLNGMYSIIHNIFSGGIRVYINSNHGMNITAFMFPTVQQLEAIKKIDKVMQLNYFDVEIFYKKENDYYEDSWYKTFYAYQDMIDGIASKLQSIRNEISQETEERIEKMRFFRNPIDTNEKMQPPARKLFPGTDLSRKQIEDILKKTKLKTPPSMRYPGAENKITFRKAKNEAND